MIQLAIIKNMAGRKEFTAVVPISTLHIKEPPSMLLGSFVFQAGAI